MKWNNIIIILAIIFGFAADGFCQDPPAGYTNYFKLRMWDEGDHPGADSVNQNLIDLDLHLYNRDNRIDSVKNAFSWMFNYPSGTFKRYASDEFDNDTLKVVPGVFAKYSTANTFTNTNTFQGATNFELGSQILNFNYEGDVGGVFIRKNNSTDLLRFDEQNGLFWEFMYSQLVNGDINVTGQYKVNGVPLSTGGGDAYLNLPNHFTTSNTFDDSVIARYGYLDSGKVVGRLYAGNFSGDGSEITDIDASEITGGELSSSRLSANVPLKDVANTFTEEQTMTNDLNVTGTLTAGDFSGSGDLLTGLDASAIDKGTLSDSRLSSNIPKKNATNTFTATQTFDDILVDDIQSSFGLTDLYDLTVNNNLDLTSAVITTNMSIAKGATATIGTSDNYGLMFKTNNVQRGLIDTAGVLTWYGDIKYKKGSTAVFSTVDNYGINFRTNGIDRIRLDSAGDLRQASNNWYIRANGNSFFGGSIITGNSTLTINNNSTPVLILAGSGSPEGVTTANIGSLFLRTNGGAGTTLYVKESGTGNTGWVAK